MNQDRLRSSGVQVEVVDRPGRNEYSGESPFPREGRLQPPSRFQLLLLAAMLLADVACGGAPQRPGLMDTFVRRDVSVTQLRATDYEFASRFSQLVTKCANEILQQEVDEETTRRALMWRLYASPQARSAAFNQDPLAGLLELWALAGQQAQYFTEGDGHSFFGEPYPCVERTALQLYAEAEALNENVLEPREFVSMKARVDEWVAGHPIEGELFVRPTAQAGLAALVGRDIEGGLKAVGNMEETLRDLNDRIAILSVQLPTEARWQADYLVRELFDEHIAGPARSVVETLRPISSLPERFETTISAQTTRLLAGLTREREAAFESFQVERDLFVEALDRERVSLFESVDTEIDETLEQLEEVGLGLIDHFFERLIGVLIAMGVFIFILVAIVVGALSRRTRGRSYTAPRSREPDRQSASPPKASDGDD
ncbi:MAG: hypothetical protein AAF436_16115 [Myxococcota bacterium]